MTTIYPPPCRGYLVACPRCGCRKDCDPPWVNGFIFLCLLASTCIALGGCIPSTSTHKQTHFQASELESCLTIVVDLSGSFAESWDEQAYTLFLELMDQFFTEGAGAESRIVLGQLSGNDNVVLFEGRPDDLRARFRTPESLSMFLQGHANPAGSPVYRATQRAIDYVLSLSGVTDNTRLLTVILSDMADSDPNANTRRKAGQKMLESLKKYQRRGGGLALYYVSPREVSRWKRILTMAEFDPGSYVIESTLVAQPQLPRFD